MPSARGGITAAPDDVRVHLRVSVFERHIASESEQPHLGVDLVLLVALGVPIKIPERYGRECTDTCEPRGCDRVAFKNASSGSIIL